MTESARRAAAGARKEDYWCRVQDLFTRDVTTRGLHELVVSDARETVAFFTREIELEDLRARRFYTRYPIAAFRVFEATAYRLSPARRILFAIAVPMLLMGWLQYLVSDAAPRFFGLPLPSVLLMAASLLLILLVLELRDKLTLKGDLEVARQIQFGLLPFEPVEAGEISIRAAMRPANTVGGDYFDVISIGEGKLAVVMGDVAGKGMPAALLMALLQGSLRTLITAGLRGAPLVARLNEHLFANIPRNRLVTLFYSEVSLDGGPLVYVNGGHNPPLLLRADGTLERLSATAIALGVVPDAVFEAFETPLDKGDRLLLYTDGITEAENTSDKEYGEERLRTFLGAQRDAPSRTLIDGLIADVLHHCGPVRPRDDMTLLVLDRAR
jgi:serine phosphatase RsbU (regulator of sigma subunit)